MTVNRGLWVPINTGNVGTTEVEARLADNAIFETNNGADARSGLLNPQTATIVTGKANMSFDIAACSPVVNRAAGEGVYRFSASGVTNIATTAAPAANSRIDIVWVKQNDQSKGDANNLAVAGVTQGAVAASPTAPAIPTGALELARATIGPNITATTSAAITQTFRYTALKGDPITVRNSGEQAEITAPRLGQAVARLDLDRVLRWNGARWSGQGDFILGRSDLGAVATLPATPSWIDICTVAGTSNGGQVVIDFDVTTINANSGDHRTAAVRVQCDGVDVDSYSYFAMYLAGSSLPQFPGFNWAHTPAAGAHTWKLQANGNVGGALQAIKGSMLVVERQ